MRVCIHGEPASPLNRRRGPLDCFTTIVPFPAATRITVSSLSGGSSVIITTIKRYARTREHAIFNQTVWEIHPEVRNFDRSTARRPLVYVTYDGGTSPRDNHQAR